MGKNGTQGKAAPLRAKIVNVHTGLVYDRLYALAPVECDGNACTIENVK
jgi:hypothetical protein